MRPSHRLRRWRLLTLLPLVVGLSVLGCQAVMEKFSQHLTSWDMLRQEALDDPIQAVGGDGIVFVPGETTPLMTRSQLAAATPETLVRYYAPLFVQQRVNTQAQKYPYPAEYDQIGEARLRRELDGKLKSYVTGMPKVYALVKQVPIDNRVYLQITYTAWYPAHPRMNMIDVEEADIDSCVLRLTLDRQNAPLFYETIAACGCFHKVFVQKWIEDAARATYGTTEKGKKYCVERVVKDAIDWDVAGVVDEPHDQPRRPVVFLKAGSHRVIGMGSAARLRLPSLAQQMPYDLRSYGELYHVAVDGTTEQAGFFDMNDGGKVRGGERRKERFLMTFAGVDDAGRPRADDQIKLHFDQSNWGDPTIYGRFLRLPPGVFGR